MAEPQNFAEQAFIAYVTLKGFPPTKPEHLAHFSKTTLYPINFMKARKIIKNPPHYELPTAESTQNPYLDSDVMKNFISINQNENTKTNIATACDLFLSKNNKPPINSIQFHAFCEENKLCFKYSECAQYIKTMNITCNQNKQQTNVQSIHNKLLNSCDSTLLPTISHFCAGPSIAYNYITVQWNAVLSKDNLWKYNSKLHFQIQC
eukprot:373571_1